MLRELDFIESDWGALFWALGSVTALFRHSVPRQLRTLLEKHFGPAEGPLLKNIGKKAAGILWGVVIAGGVLSVCVQGLLRLVLIFFPQLHSGHAFFVECVTVIVIPEIVFIVTAVALWRNKRPMATGVLAGAMTFTTHVVVYTATHG
jgi:hypothetical protein